MALWTFFTNLKHISWSSRLHKRTKLAFSLAFHPCTVCLFLVTLCQPHPVCLSCLSHLITGLPPKPLFTPSLILILQFLKVIPLMMIQISDGSLRHLSHCLLGINGWISESNANLLWNSDTSTHTAILHGSAKDLALGCVNPISPWPWEKSSRNIGIGRFHHP